MWRKRSIYEGTSYISRWGVSGFEDLYDELDDYCEPEDEIGLEPKTADVYVIPLRTRRLKILGDLKKKYNRQMSLMVNL